MSSAVTMRRELLPAVILEIRMETVPTSYKTLIFFLAAVAGRFPSPMRNFGRDVRSPREPLCARHEALVEQHWQAWLEAAGLTEK
jgi:hypothetical protein